MKYLLDTPVVIDFLSRKKNALTTVKNCAKAYRPSICVSSLADLIGQFSADRQKSAKPLLDQFKYLETTSAVAWQAGQLLREKTSDPTFDLKKALLVATCQINHLTLVTPATASFKNIKNLSLQAYPA